MNLEEIGRLVHARRVTLGLSQARLAAMAGLSRATINQLENATLVDLGAAKLLALLDLLGVRLDASVKVRHEHALTSLSQTASVSYRVPLSPDELEAALVDGDLPARILPQVASLLDEAPLALIVATVDEVATKHRLSAKLLWKHLMAWAHALRSPRPVWVA